MDVHNRRLTLAGYASITLLGVYVAALGPGLPELAARAHVATAQAGTLITAVFAGSLATTLAAGRAADRFGRRPLVLAGCLINGCGALALVTAHAWPAALAAGFLLGGGDGALVSAFHALFADLNPQGSGAALNRLNVFFGVGALAGPALAGLSLQTVGDIRLPLLLVAGGQAATACLVAGGRYPAPSPAHAHGAPLGIRQLARLPLVWALGLTIFVYVALEVGLGNWAFAYLRAGGAGVATASLLTTAYWLALTAGRLLSPALLRRLAEPDLLLLVVATATLAALGLVAVAPWRPGGALCVVLLGLAFGPIWPLVFAIATGAYREGAGAVSGMLATGGAISGLGGPWLQGVLLVQYGPRAGMSFTLAGAAAMLVLVFAARRLTASRRLRRHSCVALSR